MSTLTVLTPTYNRAYTLGRCYKSLINQTNKNFEWLIIDDGSTDETSVLIRNWIDEDIVNIKYFYKNNGGKHTALNLGFKHASSDYLIIVDSDDYLSDDAVEIILGNWKKYESDDSIASLVFLKANDDGEIVGTHLPQNEVISNPIEYRYRYGVKGDKAETFKSSILCDYLYPEIDGEKFIGEGLVYNRIGKVFNSVYINKVIYFCEYRTDGLTNAGRSLRINNPLGGMLYHNEVQKKPTPIMFRFKHAVLYNTYGLFSKKNYRDVYYESSSRLKSILFLPVAYIIYLIWRHKYENE